jgi:hypothetical protein
MKKSIEELLVSNKFRQLVHQRIEEEFNKRQKVLDEANSSRLKRNSLLSLRADAYSRLSESCKLNPDDLAAEFLLIDQKQSQLPSSLRNYIYTIVIDALVKAEQYYINTKPENIIYQ